MHTMFRTQYRRWLQALRNSFFRSPRRRVPQGWRPLEIMEALEDRTLLAVALNPTTWTAIGPAPIINTTSIPGGGPASGRVTGIAPDSIDPNTIFISAASGGVWKTIDGGTSWTPLTDNLTDSTGTPIPLFMGAIAETRGSTGNKVIYAGTGEANNTPNSFYGEGILVSTDGGTTWTLTGQTQLQRTTISRIVIDPQNSMIAYAAVSNHGTNSIGDTAPVTGIYKTINGGGTWTNVTKAGGKDNTDPWSDVVIDPTTTGSTAVLFAAIGNSKGAAANGIYESTDGGTTWTPLGSAVNQIDAVDKITFGGTITGGTFKLTFDSQTTGDIKWSGTAAELEQNIQNALDSLLGTGNSLVSHSSATDFAIHFQGALVGSDVPAVVSADGSGLTGTSPQVSIVNTTAGVANVGLPTGSTVGRISLAIAHPSGAAAATLYASISSSAGTLFELARSTDGGTTWTNVTPNLKGDNYLVKQGYYDNVVGINPANTSEVFVGGMLQNEDLFLGGGIVESQDGGATWTDGTTHPDINKGTSGTNGPHTDDHALAFDASGTLLLGNDGGVFRLTSNDITTPNIVWTNLNANLETIQFTGIALDPTNANKAYGGSQDNGVEKFTGTLSWTELLRADGGFTRVDPFSTTTVYAEQQDITLQISNDGGTSFTPITNGLSGNTNHFAPFVLDPSTSGRVLWGSDSLFESLDAGGNWTAIAKPGVNGFDTKPAGAAHVSIDAIAVAPSDPKTIYVTAGGDIFVTTNGNMGAATIWTKIDAPAPATDSFNDIAVEPTDSKTAYIVRNRFSSGGEHVFKTIDGATWTDITGNLPNFPVDSIVIDPRGTSTSRILYVGTDVGVYSSSDGGTTWAPFQSGMPNAQVAEMEIVPGLGTLAATTFGRGAFEIQLFTTLVTQDSSGNLVAQDVVNGGKNDNLTIQARSGNYVISDPGAIIGIVGILPGATLSPDAHTASVPFADVTGPDINVNSLGGADKLTVDYTFGSFARTINYDGGTGNDTLLVAGRTATNTFNITGTNAGNFNGTAAVTFVNVENLSGDAGPDVFAFAPGGLLAGAIDGGGGSDWLDYSALTTPIRVNLSTGTASDVAGGVSNVHNVIGSANGGDTITGDSAGGVLEGHNKGNTIRAGRGRSVLIGGFGRNKIIGGSAGDLFINGRTIYDANYAALSDILAVWQDSQTYRQRIAALQAPGPHQLRIGTTVFVFGGVGHGGSILVGGCGRDWFISSSRCTIVDLKWGEVVTTPDFRGCEFSFRKMREIS